MVDWQVVATIAAPVLTLFVGVWVNRRFENRPALISYYGHVSAFTFRPPQGQPVTIHTHAVVVRNAGRQPATNIRLSHQQLPDFNIWPQIKYSVEDLPSDGRDIVLPVLVPGEQVTVSYLYFPPTTYAQVNAGIKSDQGIAKQIPVLLQRQYSRWVNLLLGLLVLCGGTAVVYVAFLLLRRLI